MTLSGCDQRSSFSSATRLTPPLSPVPSLCSSVSLPEHSFTSQQIYFYGARGGVSKEEQTSESSGVGIASTMEAEAGSLEVVAKLKS